MNPPNVKTHGRSGYIRGCRCKPCTKANAKWSREYGRMRNRRLGIARVSARPSREKLQALAWMGWSTRVLAQRYGASERTLYEVRRGVCVRVEPKTHDLVYRMFEDLCLTEAPGQGGHIARALARKNNWPSPMAID